jgi:hydroxypyruvate isomerase
MKRRSFLAKAPLAVAAGATFSNSLAQENRPKQPKDYKLKHSVARWCLSQYSLEEILPRLKDLGIYSIDLIGPNEFEVLKKHDFHCSMCEGAAISLTEGWNRLDLHEELIKRYKEVIPKVADAGFNNLICFSGNRNGMDDYVGLENCAQGLEQILPMAEKYGVVLQMELFNQINHPDYMADSSLWGISLCRRLGTENFKLLYDIYHMQIQEGNIIDSINKYHSYFGHYHTAGVPGRNEIEESQELNYAAIMKAIHLTEFNGHVAQEFIPLREDSFVSLEKAVTICEQLLL